jgi:hypothetical protein
MTDPKPLPAMSLAVVGVQHANADKSKSDRRFEIKLCAPAEPVELRPEPKNAFDEHAVAVFSARGIQLGYLTAERAPWIGKLIREGRELQAVFQRESHFGAWIRLAFDGEAPVVSADEPSRHTAAAATSEPEWYPDEVYPDD